jgi:hypothetical protein
MNTVFFNSPTLFGMTHLMTVFGRATDGSAFNVPLFTRVACRLVHIALEPSMVGLARNELDSLRIARWDPRIAIDETPAAEELRLYVYSLDAKGVALPGVNWNCLSGTFAAMEGPGGVITFRKARVFRATED